MGSPHSTGLPSALINPGVAAVRHLPIALGLAALAACTLHPQPSGSLSVDSSAASAQTPLPRAKPSYSERIQTAVRRHIVLTEPVDGNPEAEVEVRTASDGTIIDVQLVQSSGVAHWDQVVQVALWKTGRIPLDANGKVPPVLRIVFRPRVRP